MWCLLQFITVSGSIVASSLWIMAFACLHFLSKHSPDKCKFWTPYHCVVCVVVLTVVAAALITVHVSMGKLWKSGRVGMDVAVRQVPTSKRAVNLIYLCR